MLDVMKQRNPIYIAYIYKNVVLFLLQGVFSWHTTIHPALFVLISNFMFLIIYNLAGPSGRAV